MELDSETLLLAIRFGHCSAVHAATLREAGGAWALDAVRENERLRAIEAAARAWMEAYLAGIDVELTDLRIKWSTFKAALAAKETP